MLLGVSDKKKFVEFYSSQILKDLYQKETFQYLLYDCFTRISSFNFIFVAIYFKRAANIKNVILRGVVSEY